MKIHFCDLCNESVPQTDLDEGRAFLRKGRVICLACDRSMSALEAAGGVAPSATSSPDDGGSSAGPFGGGPAVSVATPPAATAGGGTPAPIFPTAVSGGWSPPGHHAARPRGGGPAVGLALMAILLTGAVGFWLHERIVEVDRDMGRESSQVRDQLRRSEVRLDDSIQRVSEASAAFEVQLRQDLREQSAGLDQKVRLAQDAERALAEKVDAFGGRIDVMKAAFDDLNRHDLELIRLQQKFTSLSDQIVQLGVSFDELSNEVAKAAVAGAAQPAEAASGGLPPPAWIGLVEQLSSNNPSDRWQAVFALKETGDPAVSTYLVPLLDDEDLFIRMATATALGELGSPLAIPALIGALEDDESAVRIEAYAALKNLTKRDLPFDPISEDTAARSRRVKAWRDWWEKERGKYEQ